MDYWLGQLLSLIFYVMTLVVYNRAKKEYIGGKIAAAINLIMVFLFILFANDFADYFLAAIVPIQPDVVVIIKILLKLAAICVLFFGGLRFFVAKTSSSDHRNDSRFFEDIDAETSATDAPAVTESDATLALERPHQIRKPTLGRYEILEQIGKGAMGIVYKGRDPKLNRLTAIKTIRFIDEFDEDKVEKIKENFYREAEVVAKLSHKNIVTIFDVGEDLDVSYLAMEYLEGESLERYMNHGELLSIEKCVDIIVQVCDALHFAHSQGIIHRDIKPGNIMILKDGVVKVMDFGIARVAGSTKTRTGIIKGTPFYMSPEQAKGAALTGAADVFSAGVVFYQLLTGMLPFSGDNLAAIMYQTANLDPEPADTYNKNISQDILRILSKALNKRPEDRFYSAKQMADELRKLVIRPTVDTLEEAAADVDVEMQFMGDKQSIHGLQQIPGNRPIAGAMEESAESSDLSQALRQGDIAAGAALEPFKATEELSDTAENMLSRAGTLDESKEEKLDLSELRQVLAERKKRLAREEDGAATEIGEGNFDTALKGDKKAWHRDPQRNEDFGLKENRRTLSRFLNPLVYSAAILLALTGAAYYFWVSPQADYRFVKILYDKYFGSTTQGTEDMLEEQKRLVEQIMKEKLVEQQRLARQKNADQPASGRKIGEAEETQREQQQIIQEKLETERKKEEVQAVETDAEKRKEKERLARIAAEKQKERERLAKIAEENRKAEEAAEKRERERVESLVSDDVAKIQNLLVSADRYRNERMYPEAKAELEKALVVFRQSRFKENSRLTQLKNEIEDVLSSDDIVFGSKGYVYYKNQWVSPEEHEKILYGEGYVKYKGQFIGYRDLSQIITGKTKPLVASFITDKFKDTMVHGKNAKLKGITLEQNSSTSSKYVVEYRWEAWTFQGLNEGTCTMVVSYDVAKDNWFLVKGCE